MEDKAQTDLVVFDEARRLYRQYGRVNGCEVEFENFLKACRKKKKSPKLALPSLKSAIEKEIEWRIERTKYRVFVPDWKDFQTWINNCCWEQELPEIKKPEKTCGWCSQAITKEQEYKLVNNKPVHCLICLVKAREYYKRNRHI